jgi:hypothetical protein
MTNTLNFIDGKAISSSHRLTYTDQNCQHCHTSASMQGSGSLPLHLLLSSLTVLLGWPMQSSIKNVLGSNGNCDQRTRKCWALMSSAAFPLPIPTRMPGWTSGGSWNCKQKGCAHLSKLSLWILVNMMWVQLCAVHSNSKGQLTRSTIIGSERCEMTGSNVPSPSNKFRGM